MNLRLLQAFLRLRFRWPRTRFRVTRQQSLLSHQSLQTFLASVDSDVVVAGQTVVPKKAEAYLRLTEVNSAGELKGKSELRLQLESLVTGGKSYSVESSSIERSGEAEGPNTARDVSIGAAIGAVIGAATGGGKGAAAGAAAGAGAGVVIAAITKGEQVLVRSETRLDFVLDHPVDIEVRLAPPVSSLISKADNPSSGPRRLGEEPVALPRVRDDKEKDRDLSGRWVLTIDGPQGRRDLTLILSQRGRSLSGTIEGPRSVAVPLHGSVEGESLDFTTITFLYNRTVREFFTGTINGNRLRGRVTIETTVMSESFPGRRGGQWPASRQTATWTARRSTN